MFGSCVINQDHVQRRTVKGILALIRRERYVLCLWGGLSVCVCVCLCSYVSEVIEI